MGTTAVNKAKTGSGKDVVFLEKPVPENPPPRGRGGQSPIVEQFLGALKEQPDVWFRLAEIPASAPQGRGSNETTALKKKGCKAQVRKVADDGSRAIFAMWPSEPEPEPEPKQVEEQVSPKGTMPSLADAAETFVEAVEAGGVGLTAIQEQYGVDSAQARQVVREARKAGLIT